MFFSYSYLHKKTPFCLQDLLFRHGLLIPIEVSGKIPNNKTRNSDKYQTLLPLENKECNKHVITVPEKDLFKQGIKIHVMRGQLAN